MMEAIGNMTDKSTLEILKASRALITPEGAWTQYSSARNIRRIPVDFYSEKAVCFCASGAIRRSLNMTKYGERLPSSLDFFIEMVGGSISLFNDAPGRTQAEVLVKFDEAISALEAQT
jgi:hypothetical protein